ncbi:MAG: DUF4160 domain-containing protein [Hyphomicrobiaceae bacterium]
MPEISRFFGIIIAMYYNDHGLPHFHAMYGEHNAKSLIESGDTIEGSLPRRALALVSEWRLLHKAVLLVVWQHMLDRKPHNKILPLE